MRKDLKNRSGQGLLETIVAIGIIVTGLVGAFSLINMTLRSTSASENRLIAQNLSWEAIEVAINMRDSNFLSGADFDSFLDAGLDTTAVLDFDETSNTWVVDYSVASFNDPNTVLHRKGGVFRHAIGRADKGIATPFRRLVEIERLSPDSIKITSTVQWAERQSTKELSNERTLYNWR